ncbi:MAG TPA: glycosyltransferase family 4 protein [Candidatus Baltobacteraceae bacterium]|jgi:glycosyltransferase involved in cell wall biosynthesis|nr:glycosyltransferase family 4 protein [Candidatus Baltobacteraceae bacterium]
MRVALTSRLSPDTLGGIETVVRQLSRRLQQARPDWDVRAVWAFDRTSFFSSFPLLCDVIAAMRIARRTRDADVVLVNGAEYAWPFALRRHREQKVIVVWHGTRAFEVPALVPRMSPAVRLYRLLEIWLQQLALRIRRQVAVSPSVVEELRTAYGFSAPVPVIVNGADLLPAQAPYDGASRVVLWIGTNAHKKGLDIALEAVSLARASLPDLQLRVVGIRTPAGAPMAGVTYAGSLSPSQMQAEYARAAALLASTRYEACSMSVIEALAAGVPVIASPIVNWMIGGGGIAVPSITAKDFRDALLRFFGAETDRARMSHAAAMRAQVFDWNAAVAAYAAEIA